MVWACGWELEERDSWLYQAKSAPAIGYIGRTERGTDRAGVRGHGANQLELGRDLHRDVCRHAAGARGDGVAVTVGGGVDLDDQAAVCGSRRTSQACTISWPMMTRRLAYMLVLLANGRPFAK
jgi:hypothetical protein